MSITTVPLREFEPGVPPLERRVETLKKLADSGIKTWVSLAPVIPGIMAVDLERLFADLSAAKVSWVSFGVLSFAGYEESEAMFEAASGMSTGQALAGKEEVIASLAMLARRYGLEPRGRANDWKQAPGPSMSLDGFGS